MNLIPDWRTVLKKAWSLKFNFAAAFLGAAEVFVALFDPTDIPNGMFASMSAVVSMLAFGARLMAQKEITHAPANPASK